MVRLSNGFTLLYGGRSNSPTVLLAPYDTFAIFRPLIRRELSSSCGKSGCLITSEFMSLRYSDVARHYGK